MRPVLAFRQIAVLLVLAAPLVAGLAACSPSPDRNLVVNGDAESGPGTTDAGAKPIPPPGWTVTGNFTVAQYGATGGLPSRTDPAPPERGKNFFAGGGDNAVSSAEQKVDLSAAATQIDAGAAKYRLSGYLGGFESQEDHVAVTASFRGAGGQQLASASIGPVTAEDRHNITGLLLRNATGPIPVGARSVDIVIKSTRVVGSYNDGYSDDIGFYLLK